MPVSFIRKDLKARVPQYDLIRDCIVGELAVKARRTRYLPKPQPEDRSSANDTRYTDYVTRAVFYGATGRTLAGLLGQIFLRTPQIKVAAILKPVVDDATGLGVTAIQLAKDACSKVVSFGRCGIFVDYPEVADATTAADLAAGNIRPTIRTYEPDDVVNWRVVSVGGKQKLALVVLKETVEEDHDGFETKEKVQYRVLRLTAGNTIYQQEIWGKDSKTPDKTSTPKDSTGNVIDTLPFMFIGAENNDPTIDAPPLFDLASINIAHYRNSADYEEACYIVGQPTPYFAGLSESWVTNILKGTIQLGARAAVPLPEGATAGLLQAEPNMLPKEAMEHKERQMVGLGAKLVEQKQVQRTATEATQDEAAETSVLATCASNVSQAFVWAFAWCGAFVGETTLPEFDLNTEFDLVQMSPEERRQLISEWQAGALAFEEMRHGLKRAGIATLDDKEAKTKIAEEAAALSAAAVDEAAALADATGAADKVAA